MYCLYKWTPGFKRLKRDYKLESEGNQAHLSLSDLQTSPRQSECHTAPMQLFLSVTGGIRSLGAVLLTLLISEPIVCETALSLSPSDKIFPLEACQFKLDELNLRFQFTSSEESKAHRGVKQRRVFPSTLSPFAGPSARGIYTASIGLKFYTERYQKWKVG